jgi:hypothetical protein
MAHVKPKGKKSLPQKPPLQSKTIAITQADQDTLDRLSKDLSDDTGCTVSGSAVIRALVWHTGLQPYDWVLSQLSPLVEEESNAGVQWGKKK